MISLVTQCAINDSVTRIERKLDPYKLRLKLTDEKWFQIFLCSRCKDTSFYGLFPRCKKWTTKKHYKPRVPSGRSFFTTIFFNLLYQSIKIGFVFPAALL
jgi:hypothetical protein